MTEWFLSVSLFNEFCVLFSDECITGMRIAKTTQLATMSKSSSNSSVYSNQLHRVTALLLSSAWECQESTSRFISSIVYNMSDTVNKSQARLCESVVLPCD